MSLISTINTENCVNDEDFIRRFFVTGNVRSVTEAKVVVLLENHIISKNSPLTPAFLQKHFGPKDVLFVEEPTAMASEKLLPRIKAKYNLDIQCHQAKGWDELSRWSLWRSHQKIFHDLDQIDFNASEANVTSSLDRILGGNEIPDIQKVAIQDYKKLQLDTALTDKQKSLRKLIAKIKCLMLDHFSNTTFPKSQDSLISCLSTALNESECSRIWVVAGQAHGDPQKKQFLPEVEKLISFLSQKNYLVLNSARPDRV